MLHWLRLFSAFALFSGFGCDSSSEHGAHEVPVSKATSPETDPTRPETGPIQKIPMH